MSYIKCIKSKCTYFHLGNGKDIEIIFLVFKESSVLYITYVNKSNSLSLASCSSIARRLRECRDAIDVG